MPTRVVRLRHGREIVVRPLRNGDVETVQTVFDRLGERSRRLRFNGPKPSLSPAELEWLATVDETRHALVAYLPGDDRPVAIARLVRQAASAEIAFAVADEHQSRRLGSTLASELAADARAAGIRHLTATVCGDNPRVIALLKRLGSLQMSWSGGERELVVGLERP
jgi:ribosomal protein S18 acetylase RimI-like enzyme